MASCSSPSASRQREIERLKKAKGSYAYSGQYQQRPSPRSGGMFQRGDFEIVDAVPAGGQECRALGLRGPRSRRRAGRRLDRRASV